MRRKAKAKKRARAQRRAVEEARHRKAREAEAQAVEAAQRRRARTAAARAAHSAHNHPAIRGRYRPGKWHATAVWRIARRHETAFTVTRD